jgi:hypothetical protein
MISPKDRDKLEVRASKLPTIQSIALFLHKETGTSYRLCKIWALAIVKKYSLKRNENGDTGQ